jgi:hypothetical protein
MIQGDLYRAMSSDDAAGSQVKYIPIVRTAEAADGLPSFLRTKLWIHWPPGVDEQAKRRYLLEELYGVSRQAPLGAPPSWLLSGRV